jgi:hypothetical protein
MKTKNIQEKLVYYGSQTQQNRALEASLTSTADPLVKTHSDPNPSPGLCRTTYTLLILPCTRED